MTIREQLADLEHDQLAHGTRYMLDTPEKIARWRQLIDTPYAESTENEKDSHREWVDKILALIEGG